MKAKHILIPAAAGAALLYMIAPGHADRERRLPFMGRNFAHRGLHKKNRSIPENSLAAFALAADYGYGVELDVRLSLDGRVVVMHDGNTRRACGRDGHIADMTWPELRELRLFGTHETIPLFSEALATIDGRVPVIVELKTCKRFRELCASTLCIMRSYTGTCCIQSFDPRIVRWFRKNAPDILRGQLTAQANQLSMDSVSVLGFALSRVLTNFLTRPHFIAHRVGRKSVCVRICEAMGAMRFVWTSHDGSAEDKNDAVIFEYYRPRPRYK